MDGHKEDGEDIHQRGSTESSATLAIAENSSKEQITRVERSCAGNDFMILSPDSKSSSVPSRDDSEFGCNMISLHDQFSSQLSLSSSNDALVILEEVTSSAGPDNEVSSIILCWPLRSVKEDTTEEEVMKRRLEMNDFPFALSECGDSSYDSSISERSSVISSPCTSFTVNSDTQSEDFNRTDMISSFNLDEEDSKLIQDKEQGFDIFNSDFPSPSFSVGRSHQLSPSSSSPAASHRKEAKIMSEDHDSNEPIFWPFDRSSYNSPEFEKFMSISPRRNMMDVGFAGVRQLNPIMLRLHQNNLSAAKKDIQSHRGRINSSAKGTKVSPDKVQKTAAVPSRLSRSTKVSSEHQPSTSNNCERRRPSHLKIGVQRNGSSPRLGDQPLQELEAGDLRNLVDEKIPIEEFIGLDEFLGHEGISADAWNCNFSLCESPR